MSSVLQEFIPQIQKLAMESPAVERCGVICDRHLLTFDNTHEDPAHHFMIAARDILNLRSNDFIVWHTHPPQGFHELTDGDVRMAKFLKRPVLMVRGDGISDYFDPTTPLPYVGRTWRTFHRNCYTLLQDWYRQEKGILLPDFYLKTPDEFEGRSPSQFLANLEANGFKKRESHLLEVGDVVLTTEKVSAAAWHCSVVVGIAPHVVCLSQWVDRPSGYFAFRAIANRVHSIWRYQP